MTKGDMYTKEILQRMDENPEDNEVFQNALDIGFEILEKQIYFFKFIADRNCNMI